MPDSRGHGSGSDGVGRPDRLTRPLSDVAVGASAEIVAIEDGLGPIGRRLADLGFLPGTPVAVLSRAPLGDPTVFLLRGYQVAIRKSESDHVRVIVAGEDGAS